MPDDVIALEARIARTREHLAAALDLAGPDGVWAAYTGGKDSGVVLHLWAGLLAGRHPGIRPQALSLDTGVKFPETLAFRDELAARLNVLLEIVRPAVDLSGYPVAQDKLTCCRDLKVIPLNRAVESLGVRVLLSGIRADEHHSRRERAVIEHRSEPVYVMVNPILEWTEMDVWSYIVSTGMGYCPLYDRGYRSLGCAPCTRTPDGGGDERAGRDQDKERVLAALTGLGYF